MLKEATTATAQACEPPLLHRQLATLRTCPRCGQRVLGAFFDAGDDPTLAEYEGACHACAPVPAAATTPRKEARRI